MNTYQASVKVRNASNTGMIVVRVQVAATNPINARLQLEAQYGRGNVLGTPTRV